jgi:signal transduction histidine kinase
MSLTDLQATEKRILYIEDDGTSALLVDRTLRLYGYQLVHTATGQAGLLSAISQTPDLILVDTSLPDIDGFTLVTQLRQHKELTRTPIVALTVQRGQEIRRDAFIAGCDGYLTKPLDLADFPMQIARFLETSQRSAGDKEDAYLYAYKTQLLEKLNDRIQELTEANHILIEQSKWRDDAFLQASQELRTPWMTIKGYVDLLLKEVYGDLQPQQRTALEHLARRIVGLDHLLENLLDLSELSVDGLVLRRSAIDINILLVEMIEDFTNHLQMLDEPVIFQSDIEPDLPEIYADPARIRQILRNLLGDGVKSAENSEIVLTAKQTADSLEIRICQNGQLLTLTEVSEIQGQFWQSPWSPLRMLTGEKERIIGLVISKYLVDAHAGTFSVKSNEATGTNFVVTIPLNESARSIESVAV